jgi:hypothetical protein
MRGRIVYGGRGIVRGRIGGRKFRVRLSQVDTTPPEIELGKLRPEYPRPKPR